MAKLGLYSKRYHAQVAMFNIIYLIHFLYNPRPYCCRTASTSKVVSRKKSILSDDESSCRDDEGLVKKKRYEQASKDGDQSNVLGNDVLRLDSSSLSFQSEVNLPYVLNSQSYQQSQNCQNLGGFNSPGGFHSSIQYTTPHFFQPNLVYPQHIIPQMQLSPAEIVNHDGLYYTATSIGETRTTVDANVDVY